MFAAGNKKTTPNWWTASPGSAKNVLTVGNLTDMFNSSRTINPGQRSGTSRWGTQDRRTKPEVCAPGNQLTSCLWRTADKYIFNYDIECRFVTVDTYTLWMEYPMGGKIRTQRVCTLIDRELLRRMKRDLEEHLRDDEYLVYRITQNERTPRTPNA